MGDVYRLPGNLSDPPRYVQNYLDSNGAIPLRQLVKVPSPERQNRRELRADRWARIRAQALPYLKNAEALLDVPTDGKDYLGLMPNLAKEKVQADKSVPALRQSEEQMDIGYPRLPKIQPPVVDQTARDTPWSPSVLFNSRLLQAHAEHKTFEDGEKSSADVDGLEAASWKRKQMIGRLLPQNKAHLQEWSKRVQQLFPASEKSGEQGQPMVIKSYIGNHDVQTPRRIAWKVEQGKGEHPARCLLRLMEQNVAEGHKLPSAFADLVERPTVEAGEEFDIFEQAEKNPLEDIFDKPNASVGVFSDAEMALHFDRERQEIVRDLRAKGYSEDTINQMQEAFFNLPATKLDEQAEEARKALIASRKLLPPKVQSPKKKQTSPKKRSPTATASSQASRDPSPSVSDKREAEEPTPDVDDSSPKKRQRRTPVRYR